MTHSTRGPGALLLGQHRRANHAPVSSPASLAVAGAFPLTGTSLLGARNASSDVLAAAPAARVPPSPGVGLHTADVLSGPDVKIRRNRADQPE